MDHDRMQIARRGVTVVVILALFPLLAWPQQISKFDRDHAQSILKEVSEDVQKHYYDPKLHGVDWDARVRQARENIDKADSVDGALSEIAALLDSLNDHLTFFLPPPRAYVHDYGLTLQMIGDRCYVIRVTPGSDAEQKGIKAGNQVLAMNGHPLVRKTFWRVLYIYDTLRPQPGLHLTLADDGSQQRRVEIAGKIQASSVLRYKLHNGINQRVRDWDRTSHLLRPRYFEKGDDLLVIKIPELDLSALEVDTVIGKMRKHKAVVLDLRRNPGGFEDSLDRLLGGLFQNDLKLFDRVGRKESKVITAHGRHHDAFTGRFAVLVDSESLAASELFARVIQLERRGFVLGDHTPGMVMGNKFYRHPYYFETTISYSLSIAEANLVMADGKSLEDEGVEPDIMILPTAQDLANQRDPVMTKAAALAGVQLSPEEAGTMFPYEGSLAH
jgi:C-terminal processing protease CtpA/Prc